MSASRGIWCLFSLRRTIVFFLLRAAVNSIMVAERYTRGEQKRTRWLTAAPPSSSACSLCMEPLSVAATESAIINATVYKTQLSARFAFVSFVQEAHARTYITIRLYISFSRCACNSRYGDNYPILLAIPPWKGAVIIVSRYWIGRLFPRVANDEICWHYMHGIAEKKKRRERDCNNVRIIWLCIVVCKRIHICAWSPRARGFPRNAQRSALNNVQHCVDCIDLIRVREGLLYECRYVTLLIE